MLIYKLVNKGSLREWFKNAFDSGTKEFALDIETTGLGKGSKILSAAVTGKTHEGIAFFGPELFSELLEAPEHSHFIGHNFTFDLKHLAWNGVPLHETYKYTDTLILSHLHDENGSHGLGDLVERYFNDPYKKEFWTKYKKAEDAPEEELAQYNAKDVAYTLRIYRLLHKLLSGLPEDENVPWTLVEHVYRLQRSLLDTEIRGIAIDTEYLMQKGVELKTRIEKLLPEMRSLAQSEVECVEYEQWLRDLEKRKTARGRAAVLRPTFSFDSSRQLLRLLYVFLSLPPQVNEKTKQPSVDWDSLEKIKDLHPIVPKIQEYRELNKVYTAYIEGTLERMVDGRIYPSFNVCGTATGRISHSNPNLGQLPRSGGIRGIYQPDNGSVFVSADFSQLEVCLSAHFTQDKNLLRIVNEGVSQHDITAEALGIERNLAKTLNFAMQYGCSEYKISKMLGVSQKEAKRTYEKYWETYSGQKRVMDECRAHVDSNIPITSPFGRRRRFENIQRKPWDSAYRQAWNALVQGTGADLTSRAFYLANANLSDRGIGRGLFTVHDEIVIQAKKEHWQEAQEILVNAMESVGKEIGLTVSLKAQASGPMGRWED